jgi:hypothetical protein
MLMRNDLTGQEFTNGFPVSLMVWPVQRSTQPLGPFSVDHLF